MTRVGEIAPSVTYDGGLGSQSNGNVVGVSYRPWSPNHHPGGAVRAPNSGNENTQCRSARYAVDANGALTRMLEGGTPTYFEYGIQGLITRIGPSGGSANAWEFFYDGQLNRYKISKAGTATYYLWNGMNQLEERNSAGTLTARYTHGTGIVPGVGSVLEVQRVTNTTTYYQYLHTDHQGSVACWTDTSQATKTTYANDAFGRQIVAPSGSGTAIQNDLQFQSNWITATIGSRRYGISPSRVYDFEAGRFLGKDPLPAITKLAKKSRANVLGIFARSAFNGYLRPQEGVNLYYNIFVPNQFDATGMLCGSWKIFKRDDIIFLENPVTGYEVQFDDTGCDCKCGKIVQANDPLGFGSPNAHIDTTNEQNAANNQAGGGTPLPGMTPAGATPNSYVDSPGVEGAMQGGGNGQYKLTACAYCNKDDGTQVLLGCVSFGWNGPNGTLTGGGDALPSQDPDETYTDALNAWNNP